jgi:HEAT repeat protein
MLEPNLRSPAQRPDLAPGIIYAAKWPPDDDDVPAGPPAGGAGMPGSGNPGSPGGGGFVPPSPYGAPDGDFKRGRFNPAVIVIGVLVVVAAVVFLIIGFKKDAERVAVPDAMKTIKELYVKPKQEQIPEWRKWAASVDVSAELKREALKQLAWMKDPEGVTLAAAALRDLNEGVQGDAATALAAYGLPLAEGAKPALAAALKVVGPGAKPQVAWALVELGDPGSLDQIMVLYRAGHLSQVQRLGGGLAFDTDKLAALIGNEKLATMAGDESGAVRQLVASVLSRVAEPRYTDVLIKLLGDSDQEIARQAAPGLGKIGDERARTPLLDALRKSDKESRAKFLDALRDGIGAQGLVLALDSVTKDSEKSAWYQTRQIFELLDKLNDPRVGQWLVPFLETKPHIHWQTRAATTMARVGDPRSVPTLAKRLRMDPLKIYSDQYDWEMELKRDDQERVIAARMIADLAQLVPEKRDEMRQQAEDALIFWIHELPSPHANGMRALAALGSTKDIEALRKWANPDAKLPLEGQQPPMPEEWVIAQSALRYEGWLKDERAWTVFERMLEKRPKEIDATMESLMQGGLAILGMTLRAVGKGAAEGMSQWGDPKGFKPLLKYIEDVKNNEQSRMDACAALAWVGTDADLLTVAKKIQDYDGQQKSDQFRRACLLETLITRPVPGTAQALLGLLKIDSAIETRHQVARAIGKAGLTDDVAAKLFEMMNDDVLVNDAGLALILGGTPEVAARAVAMYGKIYGDKESKPRLEELQELWYRTFGYWSTDDLEKGRIFNWVDNAVAISHVEINQTPQEWATGLLIKQFDNLDFDNGPHSFTRVVLRNRLWQMARTDEAKREAAIRTLLFMKEQGILIALRDEEGVVGKLGREAYHTLMNPKVIEGMKAIEDDKGGKK